MSRIGKKPVAIPAGVQVEVGSSSIKAKGPKGELNIPIHPKITIVKDGNAMHCRREDDERLSRSLHGLYRSLVQNMMIGVTKGFEKKLEIVGVGFNAKLEGKKLALTVGFAEPAKLDIPTGLTVTVPDPTHILVVGVDKQLVGQFAAVVRAIRKPEPYKGTGIRYDGEQIQRKAGKAFGSGG